MMYVSGKGVTQDFIKAAPFIQKSCDGGVALGCSALGFMYLNGQGFQQSKTEALNYFGKACDQKDQMGCSEYAKLNSGK